MAHVPPVDRLSRGLFDIYDAYKKGTKIVIDWLICHGAEKGRRLRDGGSISLTTLAGLAETVKERSIVTPRSILSIFQDTLSLRKEVTDFYMTEVDTTFNDTATVSHQYFTNTLQHIYGILCTANRCLVQASGDVSVPSHMSQPCDLKAICNRFEALGLQEPQSDDEGDTDVTYAAPPQAAQLPEPARDNTYLEIEGDFINQAFKVYLFVLRFDIICSAIKLSWESAARKELSYTAAAQMTLVAWNEACDGLASPYLSNLGINNFDKLEGWIRISHAIDRHVDTAGDDIRIYHGIQKGSGLRLAISCLRKCRRGYSETEMDNVETPEPSKSAIVYQKPPELIFPDPRDDESEVEAMTHLLESIISGPDLESPDSTQDWIEMLAFPAADYFRKVVCADVMPAFELELSAAFGLYLMLESFRSFLWPGPGKRLIQDPAGGLTFEGQDQRSQTFSLPAAGRVMRGNDLIPTSKQPNGRIMALKFASEVVESITRLFSHPAFNDAQSKLYQHYRLFQRWLDAFRTKKNFNLFSQSPAAAGSQITFVASQSARYGLRLCSYGAYVGYVLHVYNVLALFFEDEKIPVLEKICDFFKDSVFLGGRPSQNFQSAFARSIGGRPVQKKSHKRRYEPEGSNAKWKLELPYRKETSNGAPHTTFEIEARRFDGEQLSLFQALRENAGEPVTPDNWARIFGKSDHKALSQNEERKVERCLRSTTLSCEPYQHMAQALNADLLSSLPLPSSISLSCSYSARRSS